MTNPKSNLCTVLTRWNTTENNIINWHTQHTNALRSVYFKWNKNRLLFINTLRFDHCQGHNCLPESTTVVEEVTHKTDFEIRRNQNAHFCRAVAEPLVSDKQMLRLPSSARFDFSLRFLPRKVMLLLSSAEQLNATCRRTNEIVAHTSLPRWLFYGSFRRN